MKAKNFSRQFKRISSLILSLALILSTVVLGSAASVSAETEIWDGSEDTTFAGSGTEADPYLITSAAEFYGFIKNYAGEVYDAAKSEGKYFELTTDIYLNDVSEEGWYFLGAREWVFTNTWTPDAKCLGFRGNFDGNGHTVYGMYYENPNDYAANMGLFPMASGNAVITNINVKNAYAADPNSYNANIGGIIGFINKNADGSASNVTVSKCVVDDTVDFTSFSYARAAGIVGCVRESYLTLENCGSAVPFASLSNPCGNIGGGLVGNNCGWAYKGYTFIDCWSVAAISSNFTSVNGVYTDWNVTDDIYSTQTWWNTKGLDITHVDPSNLTSSAAATAMPNLDFEKVWQANDGYYPTIKGSTAYVAPEVDPDAIVYWDGSVAGSYAGGTGVAGDPYLVSTPSQLRKMVLNTTAGVYFQLTNDIYISEEIDYYESWGSYAPSLNWWRWDASIQTTNNTVFTGIVDGNGYTVYGLYSVSDNFSGNKYAGLFCNAGEGTEIYDLHIRKSYIAAPYAGAFIGAINGTSGTAGKVKIAGCSVDNTVTVGGTNGGGFIGVAIADLTVENCYSAAVMSASNYLGGVYADVWGSAIHTIKNFYCDGWYPLGRTRASSSARCAGTRTYENVWFINLNTSDWDNVKQAATFADMILDDTYWYGTDVKLLKNRGQRVKDLNGDDSATPDAEDLKVLRQILLSGEDNFLADCNNDNVVDIRDLVNLKKATLFF